MDEQPNDDVIRHLSDYVAVCSHQMRMEKFCQERYAYHDCSHDIHHVRAVVALTTCICKSCNVSEEDVEVAKNAAWLHDLLDAKYVSDVDAQALTLITELSFENQVISRKQAERAVNIARCISFTRRKTKGLPTNLSAQDLQLYLYVSDADMLEAMGAIGVIRTSLYQATHKSGSIENALLYVQDQLTACASFMTSPWAREESKTRLKTMCWIVEQAFRERNLGPHQ